MGGPYNIPRNYKGESKILLIFSLKAFIYTVIGAVIGILFYLIFSAVKLNKIGLIFIVLFGAIGFAVGTFKIPDNLNYEFSRKVGGEEIDTVFIRWLKFKKKNRKIYIYKREDSKDDR